MKVPADRFLIYAQNSTRAQKFQYGSQLSSGKENTKNKSIIQFLWLILL